MAILHHSSILLFIKPNTFLLSPTKHIYLYANNYFLNNYYITRIGMVYMSKRQHPIGMIMSAQSHPLVFNDRRGNPHTIGQTAAAPKISLYIDTAKLLLLYNQVT